MSAAPTPIRSRVGPNNPRWKGGKGRTDKGHVRLSAGPDRKQYEHRVIVRDLMREWNFWSLSEIPAGFTVHHLDFHEAHNCPCNLLLLEHKIHQAFIKDYRLRFASGQFAPAADVPSWVTDSDPERPTHQQGSEFAALAQETRGQQQRKAL